MLTLDALFYETFRHVCIASRPQTSGCQSATCLVQYLSDLLACTMAELSYQSIRTANQAREAASKLSVNKIKFIQSAVVYRSRTHFDGLRTMLACQSWCKGNSLFLAHLAVYYNKIVTNMAQQFLYFSNRNVIISVSKLQKENFLPTINRVNTISIKLLDLLPYITDFGQLFQLPCIL